jgi:hypothetical protein
MALRFNGLRSPLLLILSIAAAFGADNGKSKFEVRAATDYPHRQTSEKVTIAAEPFVTDEQAHEAFGKINPYRLGILPVLIVIENSGPDAIRIDRARMFYNLPDGNKVEATPAQDVKYLHGAREPGLVPGPFGGVHVAKVKNGPLAEWEIEGRALAAKMLPAGQSASGFVYFQAPVASAAATVVIEGLENPVTGKQLYYFEIPMSGK